MCKVGRTSQTGGIFLDYPISLKKPQPNLIAIALKFQPYF